MRMLTCALWVLLAAASGLPVATAAARDAPSSYSALLAAAKADPSAADYGALRWAWAASPDYNPLRTSGEQTKAMVTALNQARWRDAVAATEPVLADDWTNFTAHLVAWQAYRALGNAPESEQNRVEALGLLRSILASGDGAAPETAMKVVSVNEEYAVLNATGRIRVHQALVRIDGHQYDVLDFRKRDGSTGRLFFNVDTVRAGEDAAIARENAVSQVRTGPRSTLGATAGR
jgi:hypothetical protein